MNTALVSLAVTLNEARLAANAIDRVAAQSSAYGDIAEALKKTLAALSGPFHADRLYDALLDGSTVLEILAAEGLA